MSYNLKLVVRDKYSETILDLIDLSSEINVSDITTDLKAVDGSRLIGMVSGIGSINIGRSTKFGIPIFEYKNDLGSWVKLENQYIKYSSIVLSNTHKNYYIRTVYKNEIYEQQVILTSMSGYKVSYINNLGVITFTLEAIDKIFFRQQPDTYKLNITNESRQDIKYISLSMAPVPIGFIFEFEISTGQFEFLFANRQNFGIQFIGEFQSGTHTVNFNGETLNIDGVGYNYKGIQPELNVGENTFYLETNQTCLEGYISYKRGILI